VAGAKVSLWIEYWEDGSRSVSRDGDDRQRRARRDSPPSNRSGQMIVFANAKDHQAFVQPYGYGGGDGATEEWRIYATTIARLSPRRAGELEDHRARVV